MMKRAALVLTVTLAVLFASASPASARATGPSAVTPWIELELTAIASHSVSPPRASRALAYTSRAMYLAALSGSADREDAVAGAASTVLEYFFPDEASKIDALADELADPKSSAFRRGAGVGPVMIARAERDDSDKVWTGTPPKGPGYWIPTPPGYIYPPLEPLAGRWRTWNLEKGSQYRPGPPPEYGSSQFVAEMQEVYDVSQNLTETDCQLLGRRRWYRHPARSLECDRHRSGTRGRLVDPSHHAAVLGHEHSTSRCIHCLLGHQIHLLVDSTRHSDPQRNRPELAPLPRHAALPLLSVWSLHNLRRRLNRSVSLLPGTG
jgi:hypothetical protein